MKRLVHIIRQKSVMFTILDHHFRQTAGKDVVFDDQDGRHCILSAGTLGCM
jgi:hypothetical protein